MYSYTSLDKRIRFKRLFVRSAVQGVGLFAGFCGLNLPVC